MINILADISVQCVKSKQKLSRYQWRKSIYFIYERFLFERDQLLLNLHNNNHKKLVRKHHENHPKALQLWNNSEERKNLISQV